VAHALGVGDADYSRTRARPLSIASLHRVLVGGLEVGGESIPCITGSGDAALSYAIRGV
jgi:hypothetical protein